MGGMIIGIRRGLIKKGEKIEIGKEGIVGKVRRGKEMEDSRSVCEPKHGKNVGEAGECVRVQGRYLDNDVV
jgi:hypothetical protein